MKTMSWRRTGPILLGLALVVAALWWQHTDQREAADLRDRLEQLIYDWRFEVTRPFAEAETDAKIAIVDIDEASLSDHGRWPWPRETVAELVERLHAAGAVVVGLDILFPEPQRNPVERALELAGTDDLSPNFREELETLRDRADGDARLAEALSGGTSVLGYHFRSDDGRKGTLGPPLELADPLPVEQTRLRRADDYTGNLPAFQEAATSGGYFTVLPDGDGTLRRYHLLMGHEGEVHPSLALEMARQYLLSGPVEVATADSGGARSITDLDLDGLSVETASDASVLIPYRGGAGAFPYLSAADVLDGEADAEQLSGALVLVGTSAAGLHDLRNTPLQAAYPGVEVHASVLAGLLGETFPRQPDWAEGAAFLLLLGLGGLLTLGMPWLRPLALSVVTAAVAFGLVAANLAAWATTYWVLPAAVPLLLVLGLGMLNMAWGFLFESRSRRQIQEMFGQYVPPALVEELARDPEHSASMEGERREMTVLFCDIRGFTSLSEQLDAGALKDLLNRYFTPMTRILFEHRGTVDKYVGDMIMAFWNAPLRDPDHARHAVDAARAMLAETERLKPELAALGYPEVNIGIGLNTGDMNVGNMGSEYRRAYTVLGDAVNLGSRLEGLTKFYGVSLIIGETTRAAQPDLVCRPLDRVQVKGKEEPVTLYEPVGREEEVDATTRERLAELERALAAYWSRDWETARALFTELAAAEPERALYGLYLERMAAVDPAELPADWDGVFRHTSK
ncbi:MAG: CHASE2 domain-containing protein [Thiohalospira sp.]